MGLFAGITAKPWVMSELGSREYKSAYFPIPANSSHEGDTKIKIATMPRVKGHSSGLSTMVGPHEAMPTSRTSRTSTSV